MDFNLKSYRVLKVKNYLKNCDFFFFFHSAKLTATNNNKKIKSINQSIHFNQQLIN